MRDRQPILEYECPVCIGINNVDTDKTLIRDSDIVYKDNIVTVLISSFFMGDNAGHLLVVPNKHYENIYDLPNTVGHHIFDMSKKCSRVLKQAYKADGITIRQNNEVAGDQHAFHYHMHVFPRYINDNFNQIQPNQKRLASQAERSQYADQIKPYMR